MKAKVWIPVVLICALAASVAATRDTTVPDTELSAIYGGTACETHYDACYPGGQLGECAYVPAINGCTRSVKFTSCVQAQKLCPDPELCTQYEVDCQFSYSRYDCTRTGPTTCALILTDSYDCSSRVGYEKKYECTDL